MSRIALILYSVIWKNLINLHGSHSQKVEIWAWGGLKFLVCISLKVKYLKLQKLISLLISSVDTNPNFSSHWSPFSSSLVLLQYLWSLSWSSSSKLPFSMPKSYLHRAAGWFVKNLNLFTSLTYENLHTLFIIYRTKFSLFRRLLRSSMFCTGFFHSSLLLSLLWTLLKAR